MKACFDYPQAPPGYTPPGQIPRAKALLAIFQMNWLRSGMELTIALTS
jgi:hypothetical protein